MQAELQQRVERHRLALARYDRNMMRLGFAATATWTHGGLALAIWACVKLAHAGFSNPLVYVAAVLVAFSACRLLVLQAHGWIRDRLRRRHAARMRALAPVTAELAHLSEGLTTVLRELQELRAAIQVPTDPPAVVIGQLRAWVERIAGLEGEDRERLRERGLDTHPLHPLLGLAPMPGELRVVWADRSYRRLQAAIPVLDHFEHQLARRRVDAYR